ncbi:MAG: GIN domain-containing protein [Prevotella sp.]
MKKVIIISALILSFGALLAEAKSVVEEREVKVEDFNCIESMGSVNISYAQGDTNSVTIVGVLQDMDRVKVKVVNGKLVVSVKDSQKKVGPVTINTTKLTQGLKVKVTSKELKEVRCMGSGDFTATTDIDADNISLTIKGSGDMSFKKIIANKTKVKITGSGDIKVKQLDVMSLSSSISGSGDLDFNDVTARCDTADLTLEGSGDIEVKFTKCKNLKCYNYGSGNIILKGVVGNINSINEGAGKIDRTNLTIRNM